MKLQKSINRLEYLVQTLPKLLLAIEEEDFTAKSNPESWSKKEIIGHLIDSATNNHQRFVRGQFEENPAIRYDQNKWNEFSYYQHIDSKLVIYFWAAYNTQLLEIIKRIPASGLARTVKVGEDLLTIEFLINDYVEHMEHHLKQIVGLTEFETT